MQIKCTLGLDSTRGFNDIRAERDRLFHFLVGMENPNTKQEAVAVYQGRKLVVDRRRFVPRRCLIVKAHPHDRAVTCREGSQLVKRLLRNRPVVVEGRMRKTLRIAAKQGEVRAGQTHAVVTVLLDEFKQNLDLLLGEALDNVIDLRLHVDALHVVERLRESGYALANERFAKPAADVDIRKLGIGDLGDLSVGILYRLPRHSTGTLQGSVMQNDANVILRELGVKFDQIISLCLRHAESGHGIFGGVGADAAVCLQEAIRITVHIGIPLSKASGGSSPPYFESMGTKSFRIIIFQFAVRHLAAAEGDLTVSQRNHHRNDTLRVCRCIDLFAAEVGLNLFPVG